MVEVHYFSQLLLDHKGKDTPHHMTRLEFQSVVPSVLKAPILTQGSKSRNK